MVDAADSPAEDLALSLDLERLEDSMETGTDRGEDMIDGGGDGEEPGEGLRAALRRRARM